MVLLAPRLFKLEKGQDPSPDDFKRLHFSRRHLSQGQDSQLIFLVIFDFPDRECGMIEHSGIKHTTSTRWIAPGLRVGI